MAEEPVIPEPVSAPPAAASPTIDPAEYERFRQRAEYADRLDSALGPHYANIQRYVEDEDYRKFTDQSFDTYKTLREQNAQPEPIPENIRPLYEKVDHLSKYVGSLEQREADAAKADEAKWNRDNIDFAARLSAEHPHLKEGNNMIRVAAFADSMARVEGRRVGIEEAWKAMQGFTPQTQAPPTSLRADAGAPGIPDRSARDAARYKKDFHGAIVDDLKRARNAS